MQLPAACDLLEKRGLPIVHTPAELPQHPAPTTTRTAVQLLELPPDLRSRQTIDTAEHRMLRRHPP